MIKTPKFCVKAFVTSGPSGKKPGIHLEDVTMGGYFHSSELLPGIVPFWGKKVEFLNFLLKPRFLKVPQCREMSQHDQTRAQTLPLSHCQCGFI